MQKIMKFLILIFMTYAIRIESSSQSKLVELTNGALVPKSLVEEVVPKLQRIRESHFWLIADLVDFAHTNILPPNRYRKIQVLHDAQLLDRHDQIPNRNIKAIIKATCLESNLYAVTNPVKPSLDSK